MKGIWKIIITATLVLIISSCNTVQQFPQMTYLSSYFSFFEEETAAEDYFRAYLEDYVNEEITTENLITEYNLDVNLNEFTKARNSIAGKVAISSLNINDTYDKNGFLNYTLHFTINEEEKTTSGAFKIVEEQDKYYIIYSEEENKHPSISFDEAYDFVWPYINDYNNQTINSDQICNEYYEGLDVYNCINKRDSDLAEGVVINSGLFYYDSKNHYLSINRFNSDGYLFDVEEYYLHFIKENNTINVIFTKEYTKENPINFFYESKILESVHLIPELKDQDIKEETYCNHIFETENCEEMYSNFISKEVKEALITNYDLIKDENGIYYAIFTFIVTYQDNTSETYNYTLHIKNEFEIVYEYTTNP